MSFLLLNLNIKKYVVKYCNEHIILTTKSIVYLVQNSFHPYHRLFHPPDNNFKININAFHINQKKLYIPKDKTINEKQKHYIQRPLFSTFLYKIQLILLLTDY